MAVGYPVIIWFIPVHVVGIMRELNIWHGCNKSKKPVYKQSVHIALNTEQGTVPAWEASLARTEKEINVSKDKQATRRWWNVFLET